jgi:membrane associated rhomboid family serine protease
MRIFWQRFLALLTPGVRVVLGLMAAIYAGAVVGNLIHAVDLYDWLGLSGAKFRHGQLWRLVTYALLPAGVVDFLMNCVLLVMLGGLLERYWSRSQLWLYCILTVAGAGSAMVLLQFSNPTPATGAAPMTFGLLTGWGFLCGREVITLPVFGEMTIWKMVLVAASISLLTILLTAGLVSALILAAAGLTGWLYLWLKHKWLMSRPGHVARSERINRLEL